MSKRPQFIVIVERSPLEKDCYGPYTTFKRAEGDAQAWGGYVEPLKKPEDHQFLRTETKDQS